MPKNPPCFLGATALLLTIFLYFLVRLRKLVVGGEMTSSALKTFDNANSTSYTWTVDISAGTAVTIELKDNTGTSAYSDEVTIQSGTDTSTTTRIKSTVLIFEALSSATSTGSSGTSSSTTAASFSTSNAASLSDSDYGAVGIFGLIVAFVL
ncbi:hypothetical protein D9757_008024 [Collybiopsis confluens]|uniref:Uncharacterized protein n=1 Tax=Collybiopsis confluens TaxID=2823264 RepID=A0A8H5H5H9_9AGAR|nr:hypothetical protein D9757_008024 [Collybiopsis confluens]